MAKNDGTNNRTNSQLSCLQKIASTQANSEMASLELPIYSWQYVVIYITYVKDNRPEILITVDHYSDLFEVDIV